jgi:catechol 2,3-dioxygenase-like lactoylglutathione lyase family enzyme
MPVGTENQIIQGCGLHHIAIQTRDLEESLRFYRDVLGMQEVTRGGGMDRGLVLLAVGDGSHIELFAPGASSPVELGPPAANNPVTHIALTTTDIHAALGRVREAGYEVTKEIKEDSGLGNQHAAIAFFRGPAGEIIEFWEPHG